MGRNLGKDFSKNKIEARFGGVNVEEWDRIAVHPKGGGHVGHPIPLCNKNYPLLHGSHQRVARHFVECHGFFFFFN